jgi:ABC-type branched-subunit amino acid transport system substrate-binding protein
MTMTSRLGVLGRGPSALAAALATLASACTTSSLDGWTGPTPGWNGPTVCVGALSPISLSKNEWESSNYAILMALEHANAGGGLTLGGTTFQLRLEARNDRGDAAVGLAEVAALDAAGCRTIIGPAYSGVTLGPIKAYDPGVPGPIDGVADYAIQHHLLLISQAATSPLVSALADDDYVWRTAPSDALQGRLAAQYAFDVLGARSASIIHRDDAYGTGLRDVFRAAFTARGGTIRAAAAYPAGIDYASYPFTSQVAQAYGATAAERPDLVYLISFRTDADWLTFALEAGLPAGGWRPLYLTTDGAQSQTFIDNAAPSIAEGLYGVYPALPSGSAGLTQFQADFRARFGFEPQSYSAQAYDATALAILAMQAAGSSEPALVRLQLRAVSSAGAGKLEVGPDQLASGVAALAAGQEVNYDGASGPIDFDLAGDPGSASYVVYRIERSGLAPPSPALVRHDLTTVDVLGN